MLFQIFRWLFFSDWGSKPKVEKIAMDGDQTTREAIVKDNIMWPNGLTLGEYTSSVVIHCLF